MTLTPEQRATAKQQLNQAEVDIIDPVLSALGAEGFKAALAAVKAALDKADPEVSPNGRAFLANLAMMQTSIDQLKIERARLNAIANPPPAAA